MQQIIQQLLTSTELQTSSELAIALQVSSKTIRNDIKELNELLNKNMARIESYRGKGYRISVNDEDEFKRFLQAITEVNHQVVPTEPDDRIQFLIHKLLLQASYIKMDILADELFISRSTLQGDLKRVLEILKRYSLDLDHKPNYGIKVIGNEMQIRFCISEYVFNQRQNITDQDSDWLEILPKDEIESIRHSILTKLRKYKTTITDVSLHNLITHIVISCKRIRERYVVEIYQEELNQIVEKKEYTIAKEIVEEIERKLKISFPVNEVAYLAIHLQGTKMANPEQEIEEAQSVINQDVQQLTNEILSRIDEVYALNLVEDKKLLLALSLHLQPAINRYRYNMNLRNPMLQEIKAKYPFSFEVALTGAEIINEKINISINENEIGYMALHIQVALERQKKKTTNKKHCLIVCASGMGTAQLLLHKLEDQFSDHLSIMGTTEYYNLYKQPIANLDFIISTVPIPDKLPIPVIQVSALLGDEDVTKINKRVHNDIEVIEKYTRESFTYLKMDFSTKEEVIQFIGKELFEAGMVNAGFIASVLEREKFSPTSFGNLAAIPHPLQPQADETFWSIVTLKEPIQWGGKPVQLINLLNINRNQQDSLKPMYDVLIKLLDNRDLVQKLLQCETYAEFKSLLTKV